MTEGTPSSDAVRPKPGQVTALIAALRPAQWTKNAIVLAAFFFALGDHTQTVAPVQAFSALAAALLFCLVSSGIYLLNDLRDVEADRLHPVKCHRPLAAGILAPVTAVAAALVCLALGLGAAFALNPLFGATAAAYVALQLAYTFGLKTVALLDVLLIAAGFVLRAIAGAVVVAVPISPWLLLCAFLLALFLALCKRRHEKTGLDESAPQHRASLEQYDTRLTDQLIAIVAACTVLSYAIYTLWPDTVDKFGSHALGFTIPFVVFGVFRYLDLVYRHARGGRPERILLTDIPLLVNLALYGATIIAIFALNQSATP